MKKFLFALICLTSGAAFATGVTSEEVEVPLKEKWARLVKDLTVQIDVLQKSLDRVKNDMGFVKELAKKKKTWEVVGSKEMDIYVALIDAQEGYTKQINTLQSTLETAKREANK